MLQDAVDISHTLGNSLTIRVLAELWPTCLHRHVYRHVLVRHCTQDFCDAVEPLRSVEKKGAFTSAAWEAWLKFSEQYCLSHDIHELAPSLHSVSSMLYDNDFLITRSSK